MAQFPQLPHLIGPGGVTDCFRSHSGAPCRGWIPACAGRTVVQRSPFAGRAVVQRPPCAGRTVVQGSPCAGRTVVQRSPCAGRTVVQRSPCAGRTVVQGSPCARRAVVQRSPCARRTVVQGSPCAGRAVVQRPPFAGRAVVQRSPFAGRTEVGDLGGSPLTPWRVWSSRPFIGLFHGPEAGMSLRVALSRLRFLAAESPGQAFEPAPEATLDLPPLPLFVRSD